MNTSDGKWSWLQASNPLIIASSGGSGHLTAAMSLIEQYQQQHKILAYHTAQKPSQEWFSSETLFEYMMFIPHLPGIRELLQHTLKLELPPIADLKAEYAQLIYQQGKNPYRQYVDFLLDWMPHGYLMVALFNLLQRKNHATSLNAVVKNQGFIDDFYKNTIYTRLSRILINAALNQQAFDTVISTQALGIPAICEAVADYNLKFLKQHPELPQIEIHQFITDIPHQHAQHYLSPVQKLEFIEKRFLNIHLLDIADDISFISHKHAKKVWRYHTHENPMIRPELHKARAYLPYGVHIVHAGKEKITILPKQRLGVIMLSSASGHISLDYIKSMIDSGVEHIVMAGKIEPEMAVKIQQLQTPDAHIYLPGHLNAKTLGDVLQNAHLIVVKSGGLSLMELASFKFHRQSIICLHEEQEDSPISGLVWEEGNKQWFVKHCQEKKQALFLSNPKNLKSRYLAVKDSALLDNKLP